MDDLFKGLHFDREVIILCVRWYLWPIATGRGLDCEPLRASAGGQSEALW